MAVKNHWAEMFTEHLASESVGFQRAVTPAGAVGQPWLIPFSDGNLSAYCAVLLVRWRVREEGQEEKIVARTLIAKCRVSPLRGTTTPRAELQAVLVALRLTAIVIRAADFKVDRIIPCTDSECV